jgi:probable rRNA maturation factor
LTCRVDVLGQVEPDVRAVVVIDLVESVMRSEEVEGVLTVAFVDEATMVALNERHRGVEGPTDVLSFIDGPDDWPAGCADEDAGRSDEALREWGEIAVCVAVVRKYAAEEGNSVGRQLAWTLIHGVLHLLGYDHETDDGEMRAREQILLDGLDEEVTLDLVVDRGG